MICYFGHNPNQKRGVFEDVKVTRTSGEIDHIMLEFVTRARYQISEQLTFMNSDKSQIEFEGLKL